MSASEALPRMRLGGFRDVPTAHVLGDRRPRPPFVSIVVPTYRRPKLLGDSILSALGQDSDLPLEVVVVDNEQDPAIAAQVDAVVRSIDDPRVHLYRNAENFGMFGNWNRGLELARGEWVTILNDDDLLLPNWLSVMSPYLGQDRMIASIREIFYERPSAPERRNPLGRLLDELEAALLIPGRYRAAERDLDAAEMMASNPVAGLLGAIVRRDLAIACGGFEEGAGPIADYRFNFRFWAAHGIRQIGVPLARYRFADNATMNPAVAKRIVQDSYHLRSSTIDRLEVSGRRRKHLRLLSRQQAILLAHDYRLLIGDMFDEKAVLSEIGISEAAMLPHRLLVRYLRIGWKRASNWLHIAPECLPPVERDS